MQNTSSETDLSANLFREVRSRMYGVLFYEKISATAEDDDDRIRYDSYFVIAIKEYCVNDPNNLTKPDHVKPIMPPRCHPGLETLWKGKDDRNFRELRMTHGKGPFINH